jgi:glycosyltransferase involved in cell wall biosynthesis
MNHILFTTLSFDSAMGGGGVRLAYDLATGLAQRGYRITVLCEDLHGRGLEKELVDGITVLRYRLPRSWGLGVRRHEQHIEATKQLLEKHLACPPDVVHGHSLFQYIGALRYYHGKIRSCYTIHSPFVDELRIVWGAQGFIGQIKISLGLSIIRRIEKECLMNSSILTAESEFTRSMIQRNYGKVLSSQIQVIPGWIDLQSIVPLSK